MNRSIRSLVMPVLAFVMMFASPAFASDDGDRPVPEAKQTRLLERFGEEGIDANGDGTLTCDEVHAFFAEKYPDGVGRGHGKRGMKGHDGFHKDGRHGKRGCRGHDGFGRGGRHGERGPGHHGMRGRHGGPKGRMDGLLRRLEMLESEAPPADFDLTRFPEADLDGDGELSDGEWTTFAQQSRERLLARLLKRVPEIDTDQDGTINDAELAVFKAEHEVKVREHCLARNPEADTDGDGVLSDEEFEAVRATREAERRARLLEHHPEADVDGDGTVSEEEARAFRADHPGRQGWWGKGGKPCLPGKERRRGGE
jgi:Ca2+-binding EF-hand superfamily protein